MKALGVIPARYQSSRFPGKPLVPILGKPMILWVAEQVEKALGKENVLVATDDTRIEEQVKKNGHQSFLTKEAPTGTDRVWQVAQEVEADIYINIQGDEPLINPQDILKALEAKKNTPDAVINCMKGIGPEEDPSSTHLPKVVTNSNGDLLYMSRSAIPGSKPGTLPPVRYKQVCIYAFNRRELDLFGKYGKKSPLEKVEDIEILRFLELGIPVKMLTTHSETYAVDVPEDVARVEAVLKGGQTLES